MRADPFTTFRVSFEQVEGRSQWYNAGMKQLIKPIDGKSV